VPAGSTVLASQFVLHRDPRFWPSPDAFRPSRWLDADGRFSVGGLAEGVTPGQVVGQALDDKTGLPLAGATVPLGLLGRTGSGKTTLIRLASRLYDPTEGRVLVDGVDLRHTNLHNIRSRITLVTQDVQLFRGTVRDNLTFFNPSVTDEQIWKVLDELRLRSWIEELPRKLDTRLEGGGGGLSAGQSQLLAFGRAFLRDPGLIILDEASSRLDPAIRRQTACTRS